MPHRWQYSFMARSWASMDSSRWLSEENRAYKTAFGIIPRAFKLSTIVMLFTLHFLLQQAGNHLTKDGFAGNFDSLADDFSHRFYLSTSAVFGD